MLTSVCSSDLQNHSAAALCSIGIAGSLHSRCKFISRGESSFHCSRQHAASQGVMVLFEHLICRAAHRRCVCCIRRQLEQRQRPQRHHVHVPDQEVLGESRQRARGAQLQELQVCVTAAAASAGWQLSTELAGSHRQHSEQKSQPWAALLCSHRVSARPSGSAPGKQLVSAGASLTTRAGVNVASP